ncbi:MAG TPA: hypothetical protein VGM92_04655 [Candidatus Kapabacteria bacterium]|jgi:hypothetical protein
MATYQITSEPIESTIIAYFDGRLSDHESAELLHRVSVSPEIRQMFQQHEALRQLANRAARNTVIPASLEESLFDRIEGNRSRRAVPMAFWNVRRVSMAVGAVGIVLAVLAGSLEFNTMKLTSSTQPNAVVRNTVMASTPSNIAASAAPVAPEFSITAETSTGTNAGIIAHSHTSARDISNQNIRSSQSAMPVIAPMEEAQSIALIPTPRTPVVARINMPGVGNTPIKSVDDLLASEQDSRFELGVATNYAEWNAPAGIPSSAQFFSNFSLRGGYNLDPNDQVGLVVSRETGGSVLNPRINSGFGFTNVTSTFLPQQETFEQLFYKRRQPFIVNNGLFYATAALSGGLYSNGTVVGASAGFEIPVGDHMITGVSVLVNRLHQYQTVQSYSGPVIFDGSSQYNFITGSFQYSISYRF